MIKRFLKKNGISFDLLESGHVLGSRQLKAITEEKSFVYTGDLNVNGTIINPPAEVPTDVDELLIESTFAKPTYSFLDATEVAQQISNWVNSNLASGHNIVLGGYSLGKSQELIKILNDYNNICPVVNDSISRISQEYVAEGVKLDFINSNTQEGHDALSKQFVAVLPQNQVNLTLKKKLTEFYKRSVKIAIATGWASSMKFSNYDEAFALSSHSDFKSLLQYVQEVNPKKIYCNHGFSTEFANYLRRMNYDAISV